MRNARAKIVAWLIAEGLEAGRRETGSRWHCDRRDHRITPIADHHRRIAASPRCGCAVIDRRASQRDQRHADGVRQSWRVSSVAVSIRRQGALLLDPSAVPVRPGRRVGGSAPNSDHLEHKSYAGKPDYGEVRRVLFTAAHQCRSTSELAQKASAKRTIEERDHVDHASRRHCGREYREHWSSLRRGHGRGYQVYPGPWRGCPSPAAGFAADSDGTERTCVALQRNHLAVPACRKVSRPVTTRRHLPGLALLPAPVLHPDHSCPPTRSRSSGASSRNRSLSIAMA